MGPAARSFHQSVMVRFLNFTVERLGEAPWGCGCPQPGYNWPLQSSKLLGSATPTHLAVSFMNMQVAEPLFVAIPGGDESQLIHSYIQMVHNVTQLGDAVRGSFQIQTVSPHCIRVLPLYQTAFLEKENLKKKKKK